MISISHWGLHKVDVAGTDNFREWLKPSDFRTYTGAASANFLHTQTYTAQQAQAAAHKWS